MHPPLSYICLHSLLAVWQLFLRAVGLEGDSEGIKFCLAIFHCSLLFSSTLEATSIFHKRILEALIDPSSSPLFSAPVPALLSAPVRGHHRSSCLFLSPSPRLSRTHSIFPPFSPPVPLLSLSLHHLCYTVGFLLDCTLVWLYLLCFLLHYSPNRS